MIQTMKQIDENICPERLRQDSSARKNLVRQRMFKSLLHWEGLASGNADPSEHKPKPMRTMKFKNPNSKRREPEVRSRYPKCVNPEDFLGMIQEHKWIESEKRGQDIGMETAIRDWLQRFGRKVRIRS